MVRKSRGQWGALVFLLTPKVIAPQPHMLNLPSILAHLTGTPADFSNAMWVLTSVYEVKSLRNTTLEFGSERVGVREVRWREEKFVGHSSLGTNTRPQF